MKSGKDNRSAVGARYPLHRVKELVANAYIGRKPCDDVVRERGCSDSQARKFIREVVRQLTADVYYERAIYRDGQQDVYRASTVDDDGETVVWYVKLSIRTTNGAEQLIINSFHIPEHEM